MELGSVKQLSLQPQYRLYMHSRWLQPRKTQRPQLVDRIAVVHDGEVVQIGTHAELANGKGRNTELFLDLGRAIDKRLVS